MAGFLVEENGFKLTALNGWNPLQDNFEPRLPF